MKFIFLPYIALLISLIGAPALAAPVQFCLLPVHNDKNPTLTAFIKQFSAARAFGESFAIPGLPSPVLNGLSMEHLYTINDHRELVQYAGPFPRGWLMDTYVREPWSGRIVALTGNRLAVLQSGDHAFRIFLDHKNFQGMVMVPRRHQTIVLVDGLPYVVGDTKLIPLITKSDLSKHNIDGIYDLNDAPSLSALVFSDSHGYLYTISDDGVWEDLHLWFENSYYSNLGPGIIGFYDLPGSQVATAIGPGVVAVIQRNPPGSAQLFSASKILPRWLVSEDKVAVSSLFKELLRWRESAWSGSHWQVETKNGFIDIPGGYVDMQPDILAGNEIDSILNITSLPSIGLDLLPASGSLVVYDGHAIVDVPNSSPAQMGGFAHVTDVTGIKRVLVATTTGLYDLSAAKKLTRISTPFRLDQPYTWTTISDWPEAGVGLIETSDGLFTIDQNLKATAVIGGMALAKSTLPYRVIGDYLPLHGKVVSSRDGLYIVVDTALAGPGACSQP